MRTFMITGGTDGIGRGLGLHYLGKREQVYAVGSSEDKGAQFLSRAADLGARDRTFFIQADLRTIAGVERVVAQAPPSLDVLVLAAQRFVRRRIETADGLESTFALGYLSRYLLGERLLGRLEAAQAPVILNVAASGGPGRFRLADLQMKEGYSAIRAATQTTRRNDLLGVGFVQNHTDARTRYVLFNPGLVDTGMQKTMNPPMRMMTRIFAKSVDPAIAPCP